MTVPEAWYETAADTVRRVAAKHPSFSANDVWAAGLIKPDNARELSTVLRRLEKAGTIQKLGAYDVSRGGHGQHIRVWTAAR